MKYSKEPCLSATSPITRIPAAGQRRLIYRAIAGTQLQKEQVLRKEVEHQL